MGRVINIWECGPATCGTASQTAHSVWYTYDWAGNVTLEGDTAAGAIAYGRSPAGEITSITNNTYTLSGQAGTSTLLSNPLNGANGPISYNFGNGLSQYNSYDGLGRINGGWVCAGAPSGACTSPNVPQRNGFALSWSGSRVSSTAENNIGQYTYQYDDFNRLSGMKTQSGQLVYSYVYDRYGNRWAQNAPQGGPSFSQSFNAATNQLSSGGYTYDPAGNMTYDGTHHYTYDAEGNVLKVDSGNTATYVYDALNHNVRVQTSTGADAVYDAAGRITSTWTSPTTAGESHIFSDTTQIAFRSGDGQTYFIHRNWLNSDRVHTDLNGNTGAIFTSLPFGDGGSANVTESYAGWDFDRFGDLDYDGNSYTYHAQFRQYSQAQGRWMSPDPYDGSYDASNPQSFNRYAYVLNNPLSLTDPSGRECVWDDGSFDSADDPDTGSAEGCGDAGGTYVDPSLFESAILTNGKQSNTNYGDWSGQANSTIASSWLTPSSITTATDDGSLFNAVQNSLGTVQQYGFDLKGIQNYTAMDVFNWAATGKHTPNGCASGVVGCLYHYGHWCGAGGSGAPVDSTDAACLVHDFLYAQYGFTAGSNYGGYNPALQEINQGLCDTAGNNAISTYFGFGVSFGNAAVVNWTGSPSCQ